MFYDIFKTPVGRILVAADSSGIKQLKFLDVENGIDLSAFGRQDSAALFEPRRQLLEYFSGERKFFSLSPAPEGTQFRQRVWMELCRIPYGKTASYGDIARALGKDGASRAVGQANGANPIPLIIPCHRVIAADGSIGGYSSGLEIKRKLLALENIAI